MTQMTGDAYLSCFVNRRMRDAIDELARKTDVPRSHVVRAALARYLVDSERKPLESAIRPKS